jgi:hypothetical protein
MLLFRQMNNDIRLQPGTVFAQHAELFLILPSFRQA